MFYYLSFFEKIIKRVFNNNIFYVESIIYLFLIIINDTTVPFVASIFVNFSHAL